MQATHETYADPSSSTSSLKKGKQYEDMKGAQFIVQSNLKIMSRSIAALSKISEDVLIEVSDSGLYFKIVNRSKFCVFRFAPEFFNSCDVSMINNKAVNICRLSMKSALRIFKGVSFGEKNFVGCEFRIDPRAETMTVKLQMNYDIERIIYAKLREMGSVLQKPTYDRTTCRNTTVLFASTLIPILAQMKSDIEVTMKVNEEGITIRNFHSSDATSLCNMSEQRGAKRVKTETTITVDKLSRHKIRMCVEFSFSLKEFMAIVAFADQLGSEVCLYYDLPGKPLVLSIEAHPNFDIELALATMGNDDEVDLDGGIIKETLLHGATTSNAQSPPETSSRRNSKRGVSTPELEIVSSGPRPKRGTAHEHSPEEHPNSQSQHSKNKFISSRVQEKTTLLLADQSWRDNEIAVAAEQKEATPETQPIEQMDFQEHVPYEAMESVHQPEIVLEDDIPMQEAMQGVNIRAQSSQSPIHEVMDNEYPNKTRVESNDLAEKEFRVPDPKRTRIDDKRNKKIRRILLGTERKDMMKMSVHFHSSPLVRDTQY